MVQLKAPKQELKSQNALLDISALCFLTVGHLWWHWIYSSCWCEALQPRGSNGQSDRRLCRSGRKAWRKKGWSGWELFFLYIICGVCCSLNRYCSLCLVRRTALGSQHANLTAATESQGEWTPWHWLQRSHLMASLSYLLLCCKQKTPDPWPNHFKIESSTIFTLTNCNRRLHRQKYLHTPAGQQQSAWPKTHICSVPGKVLIFLLPEVCIYCYAIIQHSYTLSHVNIIFITKYWLFLCNFYKVMCMFIVIVINDAHRHMYKILNVDQFLEKTQTTFISLLKFKIKFKKVPFACGQTTCYSSRILFNTESTSLKGKDKFVIILFFCYSLTLKVILPAK